MSTKRPLLVCCLPVLLALASSGCATELGDDDGGDVGETSEAFVTPYCKLTRAQILARVSGGRRTAIERAFTWYDAKVPYSQSRYHEGYRTDCSGFVSMCWQTGHSYTTADFISGGGQSFPLASYGSLEPADALVHRSGNEGHIVLFLGWDDAAHTRACVLEENSTADDMQWGTRSVGSLTASRYHAIRADKLR